jgi:hypothetical protein
VLENQLMSNSVHEKLCSPGAHRARACSSITAPPLPGHWVVGLAVVAVAPLLSIYLAHYLIPGATGFIQYDQPYYAANGREIFERGNGFAYPNPYDPNPAAPVIYFQWLVWLLGFGIQKLRFDPGSLYVGTGVLASVACAYFTFRLVEAVLPERHYRVGLFLLAVWGGGVLCLAQVAVNLRHHRALGYDLFSYDPFQGWWFLNWGRNLVYPTESVYHAIVAATWLFVLRERWLLVLLGVALLAATHPFCGLQLLLIVVVWLSVLVLIGRSRAALWSLLAVIGVLLLFLAYYFVYLPSFAEHRVLQNVWSVPWTLSPLALLFAFGPVGLLALVRVYRDSRNLNMQMGFLAVAFAVSLFLAKHEWFTSPRQPVHFTRGYQWLPLYLLALPLVARGLAATRARISPASFALLLLPFGIGAVADNAAFIWREWCTPNGMYLSAPEREMFSWMDRHRLNGVLLCTDPRLCYASATYTAVRPYLGHPGNTPERLVRQQQVQAWMAGSVSVRWLNPIDYLLLGKTETAKLRLVPGWERMYENATLVLFGRSADAAPP